MILKFLLVFEYFNLLLLSKNIIQIIKDIKIKLNYTIK